jgi:hypothetical protein
VACFGPEPHYCSEDSDSEGSEGLYPESLVPERWRKSYHPTLVFLMVCHSYGRTSYCCYVSRKEQSLPVIP